MSTCKPDELLLFAAYRAISCINELVPQMSQKDIVCHVAHLLKPPPTPRSVELLPWSHSGRVVGCSDAVLGYGCECYLFVALTACLASCFLIVFASDPGMTRVQAQEAT